MKYYLFLISLLLSSFCLSGQDVFSTTIDLFDHSGELGKDMVTLGNRTFILNGHGCSGVECSSLMEVDQDGSMLWLKKLDWMDAGFRGLIIRNDTLMVGGYDNVESLSMYIYQSSLSGDSLSTIILPAPYANYPLLATIGMVSYGDDEIVYGANQIALDSLYFPAAIYWRSPGKPDSLIQLFADDTSSLHWSVVYDAGVGPDGLLTVHVDSKIWKQGSGGLFPVRQRSLHKFNAQKEKVWSWMQELDSPVAQNGAIMTMGHDDNMIILMEGTSAQRTEIWSIRPNGSVAWKYKFDIAFGLKRYLLYRMSVAANGDLVAAGSYAAPDDFEGVAGYMIRLDTLGKLVWERAFVEYINPNSQEATRAALFDVLELPSGDILATGRKRVWYENDDGNLVPDEDVWLLRTAADGCVLDDCGFFQDFTVGTSGLLAADHNIFVYPNPATDVLYVDYPQGLQIDQIALYDVMGRRVYLASEKKPIAVGKLPTGVYWIILTDRNGLSYSEKVLIER